VTATTLDVAVPPDVLFDVLTDVEAYPDWLVGARHIRRTDEAWPAEGSWFDHTLGWGPVRIHDRTTVVSIDPPHHLTLHARMGPLGAARVRFTVSPSAEGSHLALEEEPTNGVARILWNPLTRPVVGIGLWGRNAISLQSLRALAEERTSNRRGS